MKKKLLFVTGSLGEGGAEKSLVSLLSHLDFERFEAELFAFKPEGLTASMVPEQVKVLPLPADYLRFCLPLAKSAASFLFRGRFCLAVSRVLYSARLRAGASAAVNEQRAWKYLARSLPFSGTEYSAVIAYLEKTPCYYAIDKTQARRKILYLHTDYGKLGAAPGFDAKYYAAADSVVAVSAACAAGLKEYFPSLAEKIKVVENIIDAGEIRRLAAQGAADECAPSGTALMTVGRLSREKGIDTAVEACAMLVIDGFPVTWYHIGSGEQEGEIRRLIREKGLDNTFILLGAKANPYPYVARCDVYVQPSRHEGKSLAIEEAKALAKPVVATSFSTVASQLTDGYDGLVAGTSARSLADAIERLLQDSELYRRIRDNLGSYQGHTAGIEDFYALL